jgi:hypothetical protein
MSTITPIKSNVAIDKLSAVVDLPDDKLCGQMFSELIHLSEDPNEPIVRARATNRYPMCVKIFYPGADKHNEHAPHLYMQLTSSKAADKQVRFEWNPRPYE